MPSAIFPDPGIQYAVMLKLPTDTVQSIRSIQQEFSRQFQFSEAVIKYPHLTLVSWIMSSEFEDKARFRLKEQASKIPPRQVTLNGFEFLTKTFCVKVANGEELFSSVFYNRLFLRNRLKKETMASKIEFVSHPHITIARRLTDEQLGMVSEQWRPKRFFREFLSEGFVLLKYPTPGESHVVEEFRFSGKSGDPIPAPPGIQGTLF